MQGDKEVEGVLPLSPFCIRATMNMPKAQLGFIDVFLKVCMNHKHDVASPLSLVHPQTITKASHWAA